MDEPQSCPDRNGKDVFCWAQMNAELNRSDSNQPVGASSANKQFLRRTKEKSADEQHRDLDGITDRCTRTIVEKSVSYTRPGVPHRRKYSGVSPLRFGMFRYEMTFSTGNSTLSATSLPRQLRPMLQTLCLS